MRNTRGYLSAPMRLAGSSVAAGTFPRASAIADAFVRFSVARRPAARGHQLRARCALVRRARRVLAAAGQRAGDARTRAARARWHRAALPPAGAVARTLR